jgi:hypothetical protein
MKNVLRGTFVVLAVAAFAGGALAQRGGRRDAGARDAGAVVDAGVTDAGAVDSGQTAEWHELGEATVNGQRDRDTIQVARAHNPLTHILIRAERNDLELYDLVVTFADGTTFSPVMRVTFHEGERSRQIDLPGNARVIRRVDFRYGNLRGGPSARLELLGR